MKRLKLFIIYLFLMHSVGFASQVYPPLFVSLGCSCEVAHELRWNNKRDRAFPFDWLLTTDCEKFVSLLENNFQFFIDKDYLSLSQDGSSLFNYYYNIEFRHDLYEVEIISEDWFSIVQEKYQRRIDRFRELNGYLGKVYFIRSAYPPGYDHSQPIVTEECLALTHQHAEALRNALLYLFPNLNFELIIINYAATPCPKIVDLDKVIEFKISPQKSFADILKKFPSK